MTSRSAVEAVALRAADRRPQSEGQKANKLTLGPQGPAPAAPQALPRVINEGESAAIEQLVDRLKQDYPDVSADTIMTVVHQNHARFDGRPVRDFVPLFVERGAKRELMQIST